MMAIARRRLLLGSIAVALLTAAALALYGNDHLRASVGGPASIRARITAGGRPVRGLILSFSRPSNGARPGISGVTDDNGRAVIALPETGRYQVDIGTQPYLPSTHRYLTVDGGENKWEVDLPPTRVQMEVRHPDDSAREPVQFEISGPSSKTHYDRAGFVAFPNAASFSLVGFEFGTFMITAATPSGFISDAPARFVLSPDHPHVTIRLNLTHRPLSIRVVDSGNEIISGATISAGARHLTPSEDGGFNADKLPGGTEALVSAPGFLPTCRIIPDSGERLTVQLQRAGSQEARITLLPDLTLTAPLQTPRGLIEQLPGSECPVPIKNFTLAKYTRDHSDGGLSFGVKELPEGRFKFRADRMADAVDVTVPGPPVLTPLPLRCVACGL
jgi:hypothetical protein